MSSLSITCEKSIAETVLAVDQCACDPAWVEV